MNVIPGGVGGTGGTDAIRGAMEGIRGANQAVLDVMQELHEFLDAQDTAMKSKMETQLREQMERLSGMLANAESGSLTGINPTTLKAFESMVDNEVRMGGAGNSEIIHQAEQLIDDIRAQMGLLA